MRDFARRPQGQNLLTEIEEFGLPGVDSVADLTQMQKEFYHLALEERQHRKRQQMK